jgi:hypothetical protein
MKRLPPSARSPSGPLSGREVLSVVRRANDPSAERSIRWKSCFLTLLM